MNIYVYSDESGVFDKGHNDYFVFGGLILLGTEDKEKWSRKYSSIEKSLRTNKGVAADIVANKIFFLARNEKQKELGNIQNLNVIYLP